jgi:hypothetical protein
MPQSTFLTLYRNGEEEIVLHYKPKEVKKNGKTRSRSKVRRGKETLGSLQAIRRGFARISSYVHLRYAALLRANNP